MGPTKRKGKINNKSEVSEEDPSGDEAAAAVVTAPGVTSNELKEILEKVLSEKLSKVEEKLVNTICELKEELAATKSIAEKALDLARENQVKIASLQDENIQLNEQITSLRTEKIKVIEEQIEDRTNRQMRKSIVFRGIEEEEDESWSQTEEKLAKVLHEVTGRPLGETSEWIERCHRSGPRPSPTSRPEPKDGATNGKRKGPRVINAAIYDWKDAQFILKSFRLNSIKIDLSSVLIRSMAL